MKKFQEHVIKKHKNRQNYMTHEEFYNGVINITSNVAGLLDEEPEYSNETSGNNVNGVAAEKLECFGSTESVIVGMQYYKKKVSNGDMVTLEREPNNTYDSNAVRVENLGSEKVGYVRKEDAKAFAQIMDGQLAKVEANIPYGAKNKFRVPLHINFWGAPDKKDQVLDILRQHGLVVQVPQPGQEPNIAFDVLPSPTGMPSAMDYGHVMSSRTYVSPEEMQKEIDKMFETLEEGDKTTEAEPAKAIVRKLYPHQKQALNWMMCKENKNDLPPFWKETKTLYVNSLTRKMTKKRPASVRGGILADDMGLGKTLEMISLIMTNAADGKPLAEPIPNLCRDPLENREQDTLNAPNSGVPVTKTTNGERQEILGHMISSSLLSAISKQQHKPSEKTNMNCDSAIIKTSGVRAALVAELRRKLKRPAEPAVEDGGDQAVQLPAAKKVKMEDETAENGTVRNDISDTGQPTSSHANMSTAPKYDKKGITVCTSHKPDEGKTPGLLGSSVSPLKKLKSWLAQKVKQQPTLPSSKTSSYVVVIDEDQLPDIPPPVVIEDLKVEDQNTEIDTDRNDISDTDQLMSSHANMNSALQNKNEGISPHTLCEQTEKKTPALPGSSASPLKRLKSLLAQKSKQQPTPPSSTTSSDVVVIDDDDELPDIPPPVVVEDLKVEDQTIEIDTDRIDISDTDQPMSSYANMNSAPQNENEGIYPHTLCKAAEKKTPGLPGSSASPLKTLRSWLTQKSKQQQLPPPSSKTSSDVVVLNDDDELPDIPPPAVVEDSVDVADLSVDAMTDVKCQIRSHNSIPFGTQGTLIICPLSVINNWQTQFLEHVDKTAHFNLLVYYGPKRPRDITLLRDQDVVITCYSTVASDFKSKHGSPLHQVNWLRIVLDEGHYIRNPAANMTMAVCELKAERRWVLTGTPIQNSLKDLWSLMNFLQVKPFTERCWWNITIAEPIGNGKKFALRRLAHLVGTLSLRRTKYQQLHGKRLVELPARHVYLEKISFGEEERQGYNVMQQEGRVIISRFFRQGTLLHHYSQVLVILLRLRQLCCHPHLVARAVKRAVEEEKEQAAMQNVTDRDDKNDTSTQDKDLSEAERQSLIQQLMTMMMSGSDEECPICLDSLKNATITFCAHIYCKACIEDVIDNEKPDPKCPLCRRSLDKNKLIEAPAETEKRHKDWDGCEIEDVLNPNGWQSSAKVDALMKALTELRQQDPRVKSIVVSQFTSLLSLIEIPLAMEGFTYTRLDGTMNVQDRQEAIDDFSSQSPDSPTIMLLSLKAGGVGINLTAASRVFLMDPAWNPAAEEQCFDRCHRLGQTKDVVITKFVIEDSVEERMLELQEKKKQLMQAAFYKKPTAEERRTNMVNMIRRLVNI